MYHTADREGRMIKENSMQDRLLKGMYGNCIGRLFLRVFISPTISKMVGRLLDTRASALIVPWFVRRHAIDLNEYEKQSYRSYNDFFKRKMAAGIRDVNQKENVFVSPCDSRLSVYKIDGEGGFYIKNTWYTAESLLRDEKLALKYTGGYLWVFRLCVEDYHRYIFTDNGKVSSIRRIPGVFHTVNPVANDVFPIYKENTREYCLIKSENFGTMLQMEVGAMLVGKIENHPGGRNVYRGMEKGNFAYGGSTIILMTQKGKVRPDGDIIRYSKSGIETRVKLGEQVGVKKS